MFIAEGTSVIEKRSSMHASVSVCVFKHSRFSYTCMLFYGLGNNDSILKIRVSNNACVRQLKVVPTNDTCDGFTLRFPFR